VLTSIARQYQIPAKAKNLVAKAQKAGKEREGGCITLRLLAGIMGTDGREADLELIRVAVESDQVNVAKLEYSAWRSEFAIAMKVVSFGFTIKNGLNGTELSQQ